MIDFNELIENFVRRELKGKTIGRYYPSEAGACLRKTWYSYKKPRETDSELQKVFEAGNMVHDLIVDVVQSEKNPHVELVSSEEPFEMKIDGLVVSGRIDDIVLLKLDNKKYVVEVKSTAGLEYIQHASEAHVYQLQLYMHHIGIHNGMILYVEKNTLQTKSFEVEYSDAVAQQAIRRFRELHKGLTTDRLPIPEARIRPDMRWQCKNCQWRDECYSATPASREAP